MEGSVGGFSRSSWVPAVLVMVWGAASLAAQPTTEEEHALTVSGRAQISGDFYGFDESPSGAVAGRRPASLLRIYLTPTVSVGEFTVPFTILLSSGQTNMTTAVAPDQSLLQFLQNPMNHLSVSPKYGWAQAHLGTHTPRYSELSTGDVQVFGAGLDVSPGNFLLSAFAGTSQRAVEPDSATGLRGAYARTMYAARFGFGDRRKGYADFNAVRIIDDTLSIRADPLGFTPPQEGLLGSLVVQSRFTDELSMKAEGAVSVFTRDMRSKEYAGSDLDFLSGLMTIRESTRLDLGTSLGLALDMEDWGVSTDFRYLGDGFMPLGFPYMQTDVMEVRVSPRAGFLERKVLLNGSLGYRVNNLSQTNLQTSTQIVGMINVFAQMTDVFSISAGYSNFGIRNNVDDDTLKIRAVNQSYSITPSYTIAGADATHTISMSYALNDYTDDNILTGALSSAVARSIFGIYTLTLHSLPLGGTLSLNHIDNDFGGESLTIDAGTIGFSYRLLDSRLAPSLQVTYTRSGIDGLIPDNRIALRADATYRIVENVSIGVSASIGIHDYGGSRSNASYRENFLRTSVSTDF